MFSVSNLRLLYLFPPGIRYPSYLILAGMGMDWLGYDIGMVWKDTFVVTVQVNYLAYVVMNTPKYRVFCVLTKKIYSITVLAT
jgi:hypothetical protein